MNTLISIFILPEEIDDLERILVQLKYASKYLDDDDKIFIDVSLGLSDVLTNWSDSKLPKTFFLSKFEQLKKYTDWCVESSFNVSESVLGCVSQRRISSIKYKVDNVIWLDTDIIFIPSTLKHVLNAASTLTALSDIEKYVLTPEIVKVWDNTWDCLVNDAFQKEQYGYEKRNDPYVDAGVYGDIELVNISNRNVNQPRLKFAGGWFTCVSTAVFDDIPIPESFGHYGLEDTFIMFANEKTNSIVQYKIKNLVVCEDYKYRTKNHYLNLINKIDRKEEFLKHARLNFKLELDKI